MKQDYAHLTGHDVMTYRKHRTKADIKNAFFCTLILLTFGLPILLKRKK